MVVLWPGSTSSYIHLGPGRYGGGGGGEGRSVTVPPSPTGPGVCPPPVHAGEVQREWDRGVLLCPQALAYALHQFMQGRYRGSGIEGCYCAPFPCRPWHMPSTSLCSTYAPTSTSGEVWRSRQSWVTTGRSLEHSGEGQRV